MLYFCSSLGWNSILCQVALQVPNENGPNPKEAFSLGFVSDELHSVRTEMLLSSPGDKLIVHCRIWRRRVGALAQLQLPHTGAELLGRGRGRGLRRRVGVRPHGARVVAARPVRPPGVVLPGPLLVPDSRRRGPLRARRVRVPQLRLHVRHGHPALLHLQVKFPLLSLISIAVFTLAGIFFQREKNLESVNTHDVS